MPRFTPRFNPPHTLLTFLNTFALSRHSLRFSPHIHTHLTSHTRTLHTDTHIHTHSQASAARKDRLLKTYQRSNITQLLAEILVQNPAMQPSGDTPREHRARDAEVMRQAQAVADRMITATPGLVDSLAPPPTYRTAGRRKKGKTQRDLADLARRSLGGSAGSASMGRLNRRNGGGGGRAGSGFGRGAGAGTAGASGSHTGADAGTSVRSSGSNRGMTPTRPGGQASPRRRPSSARGRIQRKSEPSALISRAMREDQAAQEARTAMLDAEILTAKSAAKNAAQKQRDAAAAAQVAVQAAAQAAQTAQAAQDATRAAAAASKTVADGKAAATPELRAPFYSTVESPWGRDPREVTKEAEARMLKMQQMSETGHECNDGVLRTGHLKQAHADPGPSFAPSAAVHVVPTVPYAAVGNAFSPVRSQSTQYQNQNQGQNQNHTQSQGQQTTNDGQQEDSIGLTAAERQRERANEAVRAHMRQERGGPMHIQPAPQMSPRQPGKPKVLECIGPDGMRCISDEKFDATVRAYTELRWGDKGRVKLGHIFKSGEHGTNKGFVPAWKVVKMLQSLGLPLNAAQGDRYFTLRFGSAAVPWRHFIQSLWSGRLNTTIEWKKGNTEARKVRYGRPKGNWYEEFQGAGLDTKQTNYNCLPNRTPRELERQLHDKVMAKSKSSGKNSLLRRLCRLVDLDRTGCITKADMRDILNYNFGMQLSDRSMTDILQQCDIDPTHPFLYEQFISRFHRRGEAGYFAQMEGKDDGRKASQPHNPLGGYASSTTGVRGSAGGVSQNSQRLMEKQRMDIDTLEQCIRHKITVGTRGGQSGSNVLFRMFRQFDPHRRGVVTRVMFREGMRAKYNMHLTVDEVDQLFRRWNKNKGSSGSRDLKFYDFVRNAMDQHTPSGEEGGCFSARRTKTRRPSSAGSVRSSTRVAPGGQGVGEGRTNYERTVPPTPYFEQTVATAGGSFYVQQKANAQRRPSSAGSSRPMTPMGLMIEGAFMNGDGGGGGGGGGAGGGASERKDTKE